MIVRVWRGWTQTAQAGAYASHLEHEVLPKLRSIRGFRGAYLLRREASGEVEFVVQTLWESMEAVRAFAGPDPDIAVVHEDARKVLSRYDATVSHYEATQFA